MSEISNYLKLARTAREEGNSEDAKKYYDMVRTEDPNNGEAKFFYAYNALYDGKNNEIAKKFSNLCSALNSSIKMVVESDNSDEEKMSICNAIVDAFIPVTWTLYKYMDSKNHEKKVGDRYVTVFDVNQINSVCKGGPSTLKEFGDYAESLFASSPEGMNLAVKAWKEYVTIAQKWYMHVPKGDAEIYAAKIQKIEPSYEMPKKGCLLLANQR